VLAEHAGELGLTAIEANDLEGSGDHPGKLPSVWLFLSRQKVELGPAGFLAKPAQKQPGLRVWTDDFVNLLPVLRWRDE
jgi:hypothetical protein